MAVKTCGVLENRITAKLVTLTRNLILIKSKNKNTDFLSHRHEATCSITAQKMKQNKKAQKTKIGLQWMQPD